MTTEVTQPGNPEAFSIFDDAWYNAIGRLHEIVRRGENAESIRAAEVILEYSKHFTILGAPYVPISDPLDVIELHDRYGLNDDD